MTALDVLLTAVGLVAVGSALAVVSTQHLVRAGLWLVVTLGAVAVEFLLLGAEFVAWVQILIYVGAVVVLLLFAVMLTRAPIGPSTDLDRPTGPALLIGAGAGLGLAALFVWVFADLQVDAPGRHRGKGRRGHLRRLGAAVRGALGAAAGGPGRRDRSLQKGHLMMQPVIPLVTAALLFGIGVYGVLRRRNAVLVLMSVELMLNAVNLILVTSDAVRRQMTGQVFALFVIVIAAAEVGVGLALVLRLFRLRANINVDEVELG